MIIEDIVFGITRDRSGKITRVGIMSNALDSFVSDPESLSNGTLILPSKNDGAGGCLSFDYAENISLEIPINHWEDVVESEEVVRSIKHDNTFMIGIPRVNIETGKVETSWLARKIRVFHGLFDFYADLSKDEIGALPPGW